MDVGAYTALTAHATSSIHTVTPCESKEREKIDDDL